MLSLYRDSRRGPFTLPEARTFVQVSPHLARLIGLAEKLARQDAARGIGLLQRLGTAAIVLDAGGRACQLNPLAEAPARPGFQSRPRPADGDRSGQQPAAPGAGRVDAGSPEGGAAAAVVHRDGAPWLLAEAMPVTALGSDFFAAGRIVLLLTDLTHQPSSRRGRSARPSD